jgi:hypothetical protein
MVTFGCRIYEISTTFTGNNGRFGECNRCSRWSVSIYFIFVIIYVSVFDDVDLSTLSNVGNSGKKYDDRKIVVTNVSHRVTATQLASFFTKFGRVIFLIK